MTLDLNSGKIATSSSTSNVNGWPIYGIHSSKPYWITQQNLAKKLCMSVDALRKIFKTDINAPRAIKLGETRQAPVYYMLIDVEAWVLSKREA